MFLDFWILDFLCKIMFFPPSGQDKKTFFFIIFPVSTHYEHYEQKWKWRFCIDLLEISLFYYDIYNY